MVKLGLPLRLLLLWYIVCLSYDAGEIVLLICTYVRTVDDVVVGCGTDSCCCCLGRQLGLGLLQLLQLLLWDSGYSVDNLAPAKVLNITGRVVGSNARVAWAPNSEEDLKQYVIYKSTTPNIPEGTPAYATTTDTSFVDAVALGTEPVYYAVKAEDVHGNLSPKSDEVAISLVGVKVTDTTIPTEYALRQNYHNPSNPSTTIEYALKEANRVTIRIINVLGEEVSEMDLGVMPAGYHSVRFDASNLATGAYLYQIRAGNFVDTKRMMLVK